MMRTVRSLGLILLFATIACQQQEPSAPPPQSKAAAPVVAKASAPEKWMHDVMIEIGTRVDATGDLPPGVATQEFKAGQPVILSIDVMPAPPNTAIKVVWVGPNDRIIGEEAKSTSAGQKYLAFTSPDTKSWSKGDYRAEVSFGSLKVGAETFTITG